MTTAKTPVLTAEERAFKEGLIAKGEFFSVLQEPSLRAALRTGRRIGVGVMRGHYRVSELSYRLDHKGRPTGSGSVANLSDPIPCSDAAAVIRFLDAL